MLRVEYSGATYHGMNRGDRRDILNNGLKEANETFRLHLTNAMGCVLTNPASATITITDNDPGVRFESNTNWVKETEGALIVRVLRGNDVELGPFTVDYATTNLTATAGKDYGETKGTLQFAAGEMIKSITVPILNDQLTEKQHARSGPTRSGSSTSI